ncbi:DUF1481 domain-containing protein [Erwiniaceae bacterium BAC15a-03b]|uniref:DUF1481 domain-containing protein n=1 Tax=Winslowiella arboricola TaxID=2978220 RepID=A0A9J6PEZ9_9GAMM|nr:DUF1481 domain-containing protein [Winslowiella arboricola]MCU5771582.1 DUF1481 domain-containing protein [Winslowiella arboricola]MCU5775946.1 DUF1481 domain-containing protein [Winslowiella arboricola]
MKYILLAFSILLAGCSSHSTLPDFTASGYLADRGAVRIWRKDNQQQVAHMKTVFSPFNGDATEMTDYTWQDGKLVSIERHIAGGHPDDITLRFDQQGQLNFMQRQLQGRREAVSTDAVALYTFDAQRMLKISDALLSGRVMLKQGQWSAEGAVKTCQGQLVKPALDDSSLRYIAQRQANSRQPVSIAWLEAPEGTQLLLVANEDYCQWEPQEEGF